MTLLSVTIELRTQYLVSSRGYHIQQGLPCKPCTYMYLIIRVSIHAITRVIAWMGIRGIFTSWRWVKMQPTSAIIAIRLVTSVIKCLLFITKNASILIKAHHGSWLGNYKPCKPCMPTQDHVILHNTGIGKYCCKNINWIMCVLDACFSIVGRGHV